MRFFMNSLLERSESFKTLSINKHGFGTYDYSKVKYINNRQKVIITCPTHGDFLQRPCDHLYGNGCPSCAKEKLIQRNHDKSLTLQSFITNARKVHMGKYSYKKAIYVNNKEKLIITCHTHGDFQQTPSDHIRGRGCPLCSNTTFKKNKPASFYLQKLISDGKVIGYKYGITNRKVSQRMQEQNSLSSLEHELILEIKHTGEIVAALEKNIKKEVAYKKTNMFAVSKDIMPDGYTETIKPYKLKQLKHCLKSFCSHHNITF